MAAADGSEFLVIAAGGTGGHMFPAQALAEEMLRRGWRVALSTDDRGLRYAGGFPEAVSRHETRSATFARGGLAEKLKTPLRILAGAREAQGWFKQDRPSLVAGFGGYPSIPALVAAWRMGVPRILHEQNGVLGQVNRLFASRAQALAIGVEPLVNPPSGANIVYVGNPLRQAALEEAGRGYAPPAPGAPIRLLIFGGSQGAKILAEAAPGAIAALPDSLRQRLRLTQQVRPEQAEALAAAYRAAGVDAELSEFFTDMPRRIAEAHLVICRAGASTIAELTAIGRPSILAPFPAAAADHQTANARALETAGAAIVSPDETLAARLPTQLLNLLEEPGRLTAMAAASASLGRPEAARDLADLAERIAAGAAA